MKALWLLFALSPLCAGAQESPRDDKFWRGVEMTPERQKIFEGGMLHGAMAGELGRRMNAVLGNPGMFSPLDERLCLRLVGALDAYLADPAHAPREDASIRDLYELLDGYHQVYMKVDAMPAEEARAQVVSDIRRDRQHFAGRCVSG